MSLLNTGCFIAVAEERCRNLTSPGNGTVMTNGTFQWAVANYSCELGFQLVGDAVRQCQYDENGELMWSATAPSCGMSGVSNKHFILVTCVAMF